MGMDMQFRKIKIKTFDKCKKEFDKRILDRYKSEDKHFYENDINTISFPNEEWWSYFWDSYGSNFEHVNGLWFKYFYDLDSYIKDNFPEEISAERVVVNMKELKHLYYILKPILPIAEKLSDDEISNISRVHSGQLIYDYLESSQVDDLKTIYQTAFCHPVSNGTFDIDLSNMIVLVLWLDKWFKNKRNEKYMLIWECF